MDSDSEDELSSLGSSSDTDSSEDMDFPVPAITLTLEKNKQINVEELKQMQQQLRLMLHAQKCQQGQGDEICHVKNCEATKNLLVHMRNCDTDKYCKVDLCAISYQVIGHWGNCEVSDCLLCSELNIYTSEEPKPSCKESPFKYLLTRKQIRAILEGEGQEQSIIDYLEDIFNLVTTEERKSLIELTDGRFSLLTLSCFSGYLNLVKYLIEKFGADEYINVCFDKKGDTALHNAVLKEHINVARYLLQNKADPNVHNFHGTYPLFETYFDNQNPDIEAFKLLIAHGANINKATIITSDTIFKLSDTGDEYVEVHGENVIKYVDGFDEYNLSDDFNECSYIGEDEHPLIYSAIHVQYELFKCISKQPDVPFLTKIEAHEVLAASEISNNNISNALSLLKKALKMRYGKKDEMYTKQLAEGKEEYMFLKEINSVEELANYPKDSLHMSIQALLMMERTVPSYLRYYMCELLHLRDLYENRNRFSLCLKLDLKIQQICHEKAEQRLDPFLLFQYAESLYSMLVFLDKDEWMPSFEDVFLACQQSINLLCCSQTIYKRFSEPQFDTIGPPSLTFSMGCCVVSIQYLVRMMNAYPSRITQENKAMFHTFMKELSACDFRDEKGQTLLHVALLQNQVYFSTYIIDIDLYKKLDDIYTVDAISALLHYGFDPNVRDIKGNTPMHTYLQFVNAVSEFYESDIELTKFLINKGVHLDTINKNGKTVADLIRNAYLLQSHIELPMPSLTCLAATVVARNNVSFNSFDVPTEVNSLIQLHQRPK